MLRMCASHQQRTVTDPPKKTSQWRRLPPRVRIIVTLVAILVALSVTTFAFFAWLEYRTIRPTDINGPHEEVVVQYVSAIADDDLELARALCTHEFASASLATIEDAKATLSVFDFHRGDTFYLSEMNPADIRTSHVEGDQAYSAYLPFLFTLVRENGVWKINEAYGVECD